MVCGLVDNEQLIVLHDDRRYCDEDGLLRILVEGGCLRLRLTSYPKTSEVARYVKYLQDSLRWYAEDTIGEQDLFDRIDYYATVIQDLLAGASDDEDLDAKEVGRLIQFLREVEPESSDTWFLSRSSQAYRNERYKLVVHLISVLTANVPSISDADLEERKKFCEYLQMSACGDTFSIAGRDGYPITPMQLERFQKGDSEVRLFVLGSDSAIQIEQGIQFIECWWRKEMGTKQLAYCLKSLAKRITNVPSDWQIDYHFGVRKLIAAAQACDRQGLRLQNYLMQRQVRELVDRIECLLHAPLVPTDG